jgi:hypothetical protein
MSNQILVFYGSYRSDRMGIGLAEFVVERDLAKFSRWSTMTRYLLFCLLDPPRLADRKQTARGQTDANDDP